MKERRDGTPSAPRSLPRGEGGELAVPREVRAALVSGLDAEQAAAALSAHSALVILAAAGAGKTRTLTARVEALVSAGVAPEAVVVTTFTRKAAEELVHRLETRGVVGAVVGTFHALCLRWLQRAAHPLVAPGVRLGDEAWAQGVLERLWRRPGRSLDAAGVRQVQGTATRMMNRLQCGRDPGAHASVVDGPLEAEDVLVLVDALAAERLRARVPDFDQLQRIFLEGLRAGCPAVQEAVGDIRAVLVDEAQDLSPLQAAIVDQLQERGAAIALVGDDDQAIYGFRASDPAFLVQRSRAAGWMTCCIGTNYRSTARIVRSADRLVRRNRERSGKQVRPHGAAGPRVMLGAFATVRGEARAVALLAQRWCREQGDGAPPVAVLLRDNARVGPFELACEALGLRCARLGEEGMALLARPGLEAVRHWLTWTIDPSDDQARGALTALAGPVGAGALEARRRALSVGRGGGWSASRWLRELLDVPVGGCPGWRSRLDAVDREALRMLEARARLGGTLRWLLDEAEAAAWPAAPPRVVLGTIHRSKGREWPAVCLPQWQEGVLPSRSALADERLIGEERRVAYVAMTRAETQLAVSWTVGSGGGPSRFVAEAWPRWRRWFDTAGWCGLSGR